MRLPIRARLTLVSAALMTAVLVGLAVFLYVRLEADLVAAVDAGLRSRASVLEERIGEGGGVSGSGISEADEAFAQLLTPDGQLIATSANVTAPMVDPGELSGAEGVAFLEKRVATVEEPVQARLLVTTTSGGELLVVGAALEDQRDALTGLASLLLVGIPAAVALTAVVGWVVAGAALRPVDRMRREADAISASEPGRRLADPGTGDELAELAAGLNRMLARLEEAAEQERRFVADASHELRTPLANLRTEVDLALRRARTQEELAAALSSVREETDRLGRLAEDLLVLARFSEDRVPLRRETVEIGGLVAETVDGFAGRAESLEVELSTEVDGVISRVRRPDPHRPGGGQPRRQRAPPHAAGRSACGSPCAARTEGRSSRWPTPARGSARSSCRGSGNDSAGPISRASGPRAAPDSDWRSCAPSSRPTAGVWRPRTWRTAARGSRSRCPPRPPELSSAIHRPLMVGPAR